MTRVLFVCLGNICRSPTAEAVFRHHVQAAGLSHVIQADSAGTGNYHIGDGPDGRAQEAARMRGYDMSKLRARQVQRSDFEEFHHILAMDRTNLKILKQRCPPAHSHKLGLLMDYSRNFSEREVPDPYFGGPDGFKIVLDMVEDASLGLLAKLRNRDSRPRVFQNGDGTEKR